MAFLPRKSVAWALAQASTALCTSSGVPRLQSSKKSRAETGETTTKRHRKAQTTAQRFTFYPSLWQNGEMFPVLWDSCPQECAKRLPKEHSVSCPLLLNLRGERGRIQRKSWRSNHKPLLGKNYRERKNYRQQHTPSPSSQTDSPALPTPLPVEVPVGERGSQAPPPGHRHQMCSS